MREPVKPDMGAACIAALPTPRRHSVHAQRRRVRPLRSGRRRRTRSSSNLSASASGSVNRGLPPREVPTRRGCSIRRARKSAAAPLSVLPRSDEPCLRKKVANHSASCRRNESRSNSARRRRAAWRVKADLRRSKVDNRSGVDPQSSSVSTGTTGCRWNWLRSTRFLTISARWIWISSLSASTSLRSRCHSLASVSRTVRSLRASFCGESVSSYVRTWRCFLRYGLFGEPMRKPPIATSIMWVSSGIRSIECTYSSQRTPAISNASCAWSLRSNGGWRLLSGDHG
mmetsp:Transcript_3824/g.12174  ORF Transcript_3824/g.12174 Transcript_3824/m.12174 type:complete len:285 (+) Transcript_3824:1506-2360(+)